MSVPAGPVLLLVEWHLPRVRPMFRVFWLARRLERSSCLTAPGCVRVHRWISRRSLLLTSWWERREDAERWLASEAFQAFDAAVRAIDGSRANRELRGPGGRL